MVEVRKGPSYYISSLQNHLPLPCVLVAVTWRLKDSPLGCSTATLLEPPWLPTPAVCHPSSSLLLPSVEVLTQQGGLLPLLLLLVVMRVQWGVM